MNQNTTSSALTLARSGLGRQRGGSDVGTRVVNAIVAPTVDEISTLGTSTGACSWGPDNGIASEMSDDGTEWHETSALAIPPIVDAMGGIQLLNPDYICLGSVNQLRKANDIVHSLGEYDADTYTGAVSGTDLVATLGFSDRGNPCLGVQIDWGIGLTSFAPFDMTISTDNWSAVGGNPTHSVDREVRVRVDGSRLGGRIFLLSAYRSNRGMSQAQCQPVGFSATGGGSDTTLILSGIPAPILSAFSLSVQLLAPFTRQTSQLARALHVYTR